MHKPLPVIGACLPVSAIKTHRDWLFEMDRDIELQSFHVADILDGDWQPLADQANKLLDGHKGRIGIHGPFWGFTVHSMDPAIRRVVEARMMQGLDVCEAVNGTHMVIHSPYTTWDHNNLDNVPGSRDKVIEFTHDTLSKVVKRAEEQGVVLVLENIMDKEPDERRILVDSFGSDALQLSVDTGHAQLAHGSAGAAPVDYFIQDAGGQLAHVHLQDADGYADRHWSIGEGNILWHSVFRTLATLEQSPRLLLELRDNTLVEKSMQYLAGHGLAK